MKSLVVSDVHIRDRRDSVVFSKFLDDIYQKEHYDKIVFLGDIFDYWMEYFPNSISADYVPFISKVEELMVGGVKVDYYLGNHDWWHKDCLRSLGVNTISEPYLVDEIGGKKILFSHSDRLVSSFSYKLLLTLLHNKLAIFLYRCLPPFIGDYLAKKFSATSRENNFQPDWGFIDRLKGWVRKKSKEIDFDVVMFGHTHQEVDEEIDGIRFINTGAWEYNKNFYIIDNNKINKYYWKEN